jgi:hypothetical protein
VHLDRPWIALAAAAAALVVLVLLDRLRRRPVVLLVASLALFPESVEVTRAAERSRRREWRDLVLRSLAALAFAVALGGPSLEGAERGGRRVRAVLGRGASLSGREPTGQTRLELARAELARALEKLAPEDRVDLALVPPSVDDPESGLSPEDAVRALERGRTVAAPGELAQATAVLAATAGELARDPSRALPALVVLDREPAAGSVPDELRRVARIALVGSPLPNHGIVALASGRDELGRERLLAAVRNASPATAPVRLEVVSARDTSDLGRGVLIVRELEVPPGATERVIIDDADLLSRTNATEVRIADGSGIGDRALALRPSDAPVRVAVAGELGHAVVTALRSCEGVTVELFPEGTPPLRGFDLTVERVLRDDQPAPHGACVFVCPPPEAGGVVPAKLELGARARSLVPAAVAADLASALAPVRSVRREPPPNLGELEPIVASGGVPLLAASGKDRGGSLAVYVGFDLASRAVEDGWARDASFPLFWAELVERVRERPDAPPALECHPTGAPLVLPRPADALPGAPLEVILPGEPARVRRIHGSSFVPLEAGVYRVRADGAKSEALFAAALLDPGTQDLRGGKTRPFDAETLALLERRDAPLRRASLVPIWALLGLAFVAAAWALGTSERQRAR